MKWESLINNYKSQNHTVYVNIILATKEYVIARRDLIENPCAWRSDVGSVEDPIWKEFYDQEDRYNTACKNLWEATDIEYGSSDLANAAWEWRYWKVMSRKCCFFLEKRDTMYMASETMKKLADAEFNFIILCGLEELFVPTTKNINEQFVKINNEHI